MLRTIGYACAVLTIGSVAIAWTHGPGPRSTGATLAPDQMHFNTASLPVQEFTDLTFVFANE